MGDAAERRRRSDTVWSSLDIYDTRNRKVATALAAIARLFDEQRPLQGGESEFLSLYDNLHALSPQAFTRLVSSPEAYCWVHHAYELIQIHFRSGNGEREDTKGPISKHLEAFKVLAAGAFFTDGQAIAFDAPCSCEMPVNLPCTNLLLDGDGPVSLHGVAGGQVHVSVGGEKFRLSPQSDRPEEPGREPVSLLRQALLSLDGGEILLSPYVFQPSRIESADRANTLAVGYEGHHRLLPRMQESFEVMRRFAPDDYKQIAATVSCIGLNDPAQSDRSQTSLSDMPGTFIVPCYVNPFPNIECIIHEYFHNRLFALEEAGQIFIDQEDEQGRSARTLFSPWRVAARPIKGLLHSTYVFIPVTRFWLAVYEGTDDADPIRAYALDDSIRQILNLRIGMHLLRNHGRFTEYGETIIAAMESSVAEIIERAEQAGIAHDAPAMQNNLDGTVTPLKWSGYERTVTVRENLRANIQHHDVNGDCRDLPFAI
ncbi:HEXXH motif-containing putative peptide modification protein [Wenzhouxiangellaceae bacterium CH-27]|uniref:HEXXH motif-containing putative peptide modification protein n=2 Tax=Elongatibacter sediminis TaxID=3119006 RepID=A0AAW9R572_9GAMM